MRKICFVTGTRADYGLLSPIMKRVGDDAECRLQVIATNMHLLPEYGNTYKDIEADGFQIDEKVLMPRNGDGASATIQAMSAELIGMDAALARLSPDIVVVLGDRYEMFIVAVVCLLRRIPLAHIHGGEITEGAVDDALRHSITKMASLHFTATEEYRRRVIQLGENPGRVVWAGAPGVENIKSLVPMKKDELEASLGLKLDSPFVVATYHPATLGRVAPDQEIDAFLKALGHFPQLRVIFTLPNSDPGSDRIRSAIEEYCRNSAGRCACFVSLGMRRYLSLISMSEAVIGNSSSGIIEAPSMHVPTLNIGDRQRGRARGKSVIDCATDESSIVAGLSLALSPQAAEIARAAENPYEKEGASSIIFNVLKSADLAAISRKSFFDLPSPA
ncbi:MAG: UDP-N-acetylglucosamine 2-epimerase [Lachnospiraceae bacterium]|nr:UDP-N-acetylglucosamine 2-epimerase [Lachnospiraceae bacterium]